MIPSDHREDQSYGNGSHIIYSDGHGKTWKLGSTLQPGANECQTVELADGSLMLNIRMQTYNQARRAVAISKDSGESWSGFKHDKNLPGPICQASFIRYSLANGGGKNRLLFSNPNSVGDPNSSDKKKRKGSRVNMTVRMSYDEGKTWPVARQVHAEASAYSCLAVLANGEIGLLYEKGEGQQYDRLTFARFSVDWLTERKDRK